MFAEQIRAALPGTPRVRLAELAAAVWKGFACGAIDETDAQQLADEIHARKAIPAPAMPARRVGSRPRSSTSLERRRSWTASGWLPPALAARFTMGEAAALGVILAEVALKGHCELSHGSVGGRAGVSVSTVKRALTEARKLGLVAVEVRRVSWCRNLPNVITVLSAELRTWVATRGRGLRAAKGQGGGVQIGAAPKFISISNENRTSQIASKVGSRERDGAATRFARRSVEV
ncbi:MAG: hypothetical protein ACRYGP_08225 [Janthinobacterium lividum]